MKRVKEVKIIMSGLIVLFGGIGLYYVNLPNTIVVLVFLGLVGIHCVPD